jgi:hypothetical protein
MLINYVVEWMKENNVPLTRGNCLHISYMGQEVPDEEDEENLPPEVRAD